MNTYVIPKSNHQDLRIAEGGLYHFFISDKEFSLIVDNVEYPDLPDNVQQPDDSDVIKVNFHCFSYIKIHFIYTRSEVSADNVIEFGNRTADDELLEYRCVVRYADEIKVATECRVEIVCQDIELEFLDQAELIGPENRLRKIRTMYEEKTHSSFW